MNRNGAPARVAGERAESVVQVAILLTIGAVAAAASFTHVHNVAAAHGQPGWLAWADAVVLELMSIATGLEIRRRARTGRKRAFVGGVLVASVLLSLAAQVVEAERSIIGWLAAALPALGFLACVKIVLGRTATRVVSGVQPAQEPTVAPPPRTWNWSLRPTRLAQERWRPYRRWHSAGPTQPASTVEIHDDRPCGRSGPGRAIPSAGLPGSAADYAQGNRRAQDAGHRLRRLHAARHAAPNGPGHWKDRDHRPAVRRHAGGQVPRLCQAGAAAAAGADPRGLAPDRRTESRTAPGDRRTAGAHRAAGSLRVLPGGSRT